MRPRISVLIAARKNSKYLAKFLHGLLAKTADIGEIEVLVMLNKGDTWNRDLVSNYTGFFSFYDEDYQLGRAGLHVYFNDLYKHATGDWILYFCEDHYIIEQNWDQELRAIIAGTALAEITPGQPAALQHQQGRLNPTMIWCIIPKFDNAGSMNHVLSRGLIEHMGGYLAQHGNLDSYLNDVIRHIPRDRRIAMDQALFHDFTHDVPSPMADAHLQAEISPAARQMPRYEDTSIESSIIDDAAKLQRAIKEGF